MPTRAPYTGTKRRLVLAFDLGTTYSGVSYAILDPGKTPEIKTVSRYPGQEAGDSKVQTVIYYDVEGKVLAIGADEAPIGDDGDEDDWEDIQPHKLEWFKLLMRPKASTTPEGVPEPKLPPSKTITDVYADFYRYLFDRTRIFIRQTHANGELLWDSVAHNIDFVLSHPNGWEGAQQSKMRDAAIKADLIPDTPEGRERITFVTEGEASFHYCVSSGLVAASIGVGKNVMIIDAGGGTVDLSTYTFSKEAPIKVEEIAAPSYVFEGSVLLRQRAEHHLTAKLRNSRFGTQEYIEMISDEFDKVTKKRFKDNGDSYIKFSNLTGDRDLNVGIRNGQIKLSSEEMRCFFDPSVDHIIEAIKAQQVAAASATVSTYFLVGGFGASEYLHDRIESFLGELGMRLYRPDSHSSKAVAEGAVSFAIDHFVKTRVAKHTYGTVISIEYEPYNPKHVARSAWRFEDADGKQVMNNYFQPLVEKGTRVSETKEFTYPLVVKKEDTKVQRVHLHVVCHRGESPPPEFVDEDPVVDVSTFPQTRHLNYKSFDKHYYCQNFTVTLSFGMTELKADLSLEVYYGVSYYRTPARIVYPDEESAKAVGTTCHLHKEREEKV